jgi:hypothetical protein
LDYWVGKLEWATTEAEYKKYFEGIKKLYEVYHVQHHIEIEFPKVTSWELIYASEHTEIVHGADLHTTEVNYSVQVGHFEHLFNKTFDHAEYDKLIKQIHELELKAKHEGIAKWQIAVPDWNHCPCNAAHAA